MAMNRREFMKGMAAMPLVAMRMSPAGRRLHQLAGQTDPSRPNVLILVFDTFSAPHASLYGYGRETTPHLSRFAEGANVYHNHVAAGNFTSPGTASLLTGTYPWTHRAMHLHGTINPLLAGQNIFQAFDEGYYKITYTHNPLVSSLLFQFQGAIDQLKQTRDLCLADFRYTERLFEKDYTPSLVSEFHMRQGAQIAGSLFLSLADMVQKVIVKKVLADQLDGRFPRGVPLRPHSFYFVLEDVVDWLLAELPRLPQPFLAYIHLLPPHGPYTTRREFTDIFTSDGFQVAQKAKNFTDQGHNQGNLDQLRALYDEYIPYVDAEFGRFSAGLQESSIGDNTLLAVTSDHGELFERGIFGHITSALYQGITHVPLLIKRPGQAERWDIHTATSCVDLLPTLLAETGQPIPDWCEGQILPGFAAGADDPDRPVFSVEAKGNVKLAPLDKVSVSMIKGDYKLIYYRGYGEGEEQMELFNLAADPGELDDLSQKETAVAQTMRDELIDYLERFDRV